MPRLTRTRAIAVSGAESALAVDLAAGCVGTSAPPGVLGHEEEQARGVWQTGNAVFAAPERGEPRANFGSGSAEWSTAVKGTWYAQQYRRTTAGDGSRGRFGH
jgi:trehalose/maltose transport system substrate-binding protein